MKKIIIFFINVMLFVQPNVFSQNGLPYQAVVRDNKGVALANQDVNVKFSIHQKTSNGTTVYEEIHSVKTNGKGGVKLEIGSGKTISGTFNQIDWSKGPYFIQTQLDKGQGYQISGSQELLSVPYAKKAEVVGGLQKKSPDGRTWQLTIDNSGNIQVIPIPVGYAKLVFQDEFTGTGLPDPTKWSTWSPSQDRQPNTVHQYYTKNRLENLYQENGILNMVCRNDSFIENGDLFPVTSSAIQTRNKGDWKYCRIEVKVKIPACSGTWPAIWMMPTSNDIYGYWPNGGEIDILEQLGNEPYKFWYTCHSKKYTSNTEYGARGTSVTWMNALTNWHVFALEWHEDRLEWYCDDKLQYRVRKTENTWQAWPYNQKFFLILNFAYGYGWGKQGGYNLNGLPLTYQVDYVRVFQ